MKVAQCRSCDAPIIWTLTIGGSRQPVDAKPSPKVGNLLLVKRNDDTPLSLSISRLDEAQRAAAKRNGVALYMPHHGTCPDGDSWRK
ncbi:MAG TPA: hypothetical protein VLD58_08540 [Gemmatimonadales bacterium]|nr:hypothetical protein [Gemmatimonadales bacterium]